MANIRSSGALLALALGLLFGTGTAAAQDDARAFQANLTGQEEVPPKDTTASGQASFLLLDSGQMQYDVVINSPTTTPIQLAHIHLGNVGENGPVVVNLCGTSDTPECGQTGDIASGTFGPERLTGPLAGMTMDDLVAAMRHGRTYANVHTTANPGGEIRGQIQIASQHTPAGDTDNQGQHHGADNQNDDGAQAQHGHQDTSGD